MKIDDRIEQLVRNTLDAAVHRDEARLQAALAAFRDEATVRAGLELALAVSVLVLFDVESGRPSATRVAKLAEEISEQEAWIGLDLAETAGYLNTLTTGAPLIDTLSPEGMVIVPYLVAANLLTTGSRPDQGEWWFNYLDKVETAIEAAIPTP